MLNERNKRRLAKKVGRAKSKNARVQQLVDRPDIPEIYTLDDDGTGKMLVFDVRRLRAWTAANRQPISVGLQTWRAERLVDTGAVDIEHIIQHTVRHKADPIIVCLAAAGSGEDVIVDGSHRYVAAAIVAGQTGASDMGYPGYVLSPAEWRPFIIPLSANTRG